MGNRGSVNRRDALRILAGTTAIGLAGCGSLQDGGNQMPEDGTRSGDGNSGADHGERVPTITLEFFSDRPGQSDMMSQWAEIYQENLNSLGVTAEMLPQQSNSMVNNINQDSRIIHGAQWGNAIAEDPDRYLRFFTARTGASSLPGWVNWSQWVNCDYEKHYIDQQRATTEEDRRQSVYEAISAMSNDKIHLTQFPYINYGAYRKDLLELDGVGSVGMDRWTYIKSSHRNGGVIVTNTIPERISTLNAENITGGGTQLLGTLLYSPLIDFDEQSELTNILSSNYEISNEGKRHTFELRDGLTFHDGTPITAEDVEFSFELHRRNQSWSKALFSWDVFDSFDVIDDSQFAINWTEPNLLSLQVPHPEFEVLPKHVWSGAMDDPIQFNPDPPIGSGPYKVSGFESGNYLRLVPHEGHPFEAKSDLLIQSFQDQTSAIQAFKQGEINLISGLSHGGFMNLRDSTSSDRVEVVSTPTTAVFYYLMQCHTSPVKFEEFRDAMGTVMDRELMNQVTFGGLNEPELHSTMFMKGNPWRPPDDMLHQFTDDPNGDAEAAREKLAQAGWTWDGDGNLRYPQDADIAPLWPQGENPADEKFHCISVEGDSYTVNV